MVRMLRMPLSLALRTLFLLSAAPVAYPCHEASILELGRNRFEYVDWGGTGEAVLLVPGGCDTANVFDDFAPLLTPRFHVLGLTPSGCGLLSSAMDEYGIDRQIDELIAFMDALGIARGSFAGHSSGGGKIVRLARRYPTRVRAIVTLDIVYRGVPDNFETMMHEAISSRVGAATTISLESHRRSFQAWELGAWSPALECDFDQKTVRQSDGSLVYRDRPAGWQLAFVDDMKAGRYYETAIRHPALLFVARDLDLNRIRQFPVAQQRQLRPLVQRVIEARREQLKDFQDNGRNVKFISMPNASHYLFIDRAKVVASETIKFLQGAGSRR